jgi:hypothetical protein
MVSPNSIFTFWSRIGPTAKIHPADQYVFRRVGKRGHRLRLKCLPCPFAGRLKDALVVFLFLSPGFSSRDLKDAKTRRGQAHYSKKRKGLQPWSEQDAGAEWLKKILKMFELDFEAARNKVAVLDIGAYHSKEFRDYPLLAALPSSRVSLEWAQGVLFPQAIRGERVVVCLRSAHFWGLERGTNLGRLFVPDVTRGGRMRRTTHTQKKMREKIIRAVRSALKE